MSGSRVAACRCGQLTATCVGDPVRISVCHCLACKRRTGGPFSAQARFPVATVTIVGEWKVWERVAESGRRAWYRWCPDCGATVAYVNEGVEDMLAIPVGAFADPDFPGAEMAIHSIHENRRQDWVAIVGDRVVHSE